MPFSGRKKAALLKATLCGADSAKDQYKEGETKAMKNLMVILERYVDLDGIKLRIGGVVTRDVAHYHGVPHGAVQVAVVALMSGQPHFLLHKRSQWKKTSPNTWDICGGHIDATENILANMSVWDDQSVIAEFFSDTALREANEELHIIPKPEFEFEKEHLRCFGGLGVFECGFDDPNAQNREFSAFYLAFVPASIKLKDSDKVEKVFEVMDTVGVAGKQKEMVALELRLVTLGDLVQDFRANSKEYADGISRVLLRVAKEPGTMKALNQCLDQYYK